jgi:hypothetical protein
MNAWITKPTFGQAKVVARFGDTGAEILTQ